jgi:hypothetical protein
MRATITLADDVAASLKRLRRSRGIELNDMVNLVMREGLKSLATPAKRGKKFRTRAVDLGACRMAKVDDIAEVLAISEAAKTA